MQHPHPLDFSSQYCTSTSELAVHDDDASGGRMMTPSAVGSLRSSLLLTPDECLRAAHPDYCMLGYHSAYTVQYCSSAGHVATCLPPRGRAWFPGGEGPTVGSHKTPTRPPSQVLALPFIPLLSSQQRRPKTHRRGPDILDFRASLDQRQGREPWAVSPSKLPRNPG